MKYEKIVEGIFIKRPNRFIAHVLIDGKEEICHVKNTGRCGELLIPGVLLFLEQGKNPNRKTKYSVIAVKKGERLINMDSQAPNQVVEEWLRETEYFQNTKLIKREKTYGDSRLDFYVETDTSQILLEVKGVTLEENSVVRFPDAPTERGIKHIRELSKAINEGYETYIVFVIQMEGVSYFTPNNRTHPQFGKALIEAEKSGVKILALDCFVTPDTLKIRNEVPVILEE